MSIPVLPAQPNPGFEGMPMPAAEISQPTIWGPEMRQAHLESLPAHGFTPEQHAQTVDQIVSVGLPVNNFTSVHRKPNTLGREGWAGSWGHGTQNFGEFSVYELLDRVVPEQKLGVIAHESLHANTPLNPDNDHLYGGEAERQVIESHVWAATAQSWATGIHLNSYHKDLLAAHAKGQLSKGTRENDQILAEETFAIMGEMALTNRNGLLDVQERQHRAMDDLNRINRIQGQPPLEKVNLVTPEGSKGGVSGVDYALVRLIDGVDTHQDLLDHIYSLKAKFYPAKSFEVVKMREEIRGQVHEKQIVIPAIEAYLANIQRKIDDDEEDDDSTAA